ncbi:MAG: SCO family protein [Alphaproteobacteria bacterium]
MLVRAIGFAAVLVAGLAITDPAAWAHGTEKHAAVEKTVAAPAPAPKAGAGGEPLAIGVGGPFALIDQTGQLVTDKDFLGRYMLVFFGYANCPGICPTALKAMADALDELGDEGGQVASILITVDPEHDKPEALAPAVAKIHPRLIGLTGTREQLSATAAVYGVTSKPVGRSLNGIDMFSHGSLVYLMGPDGKLLTIFPPIVDGSTMAATIRGYMG